MNKKIILCALLILFASGDAAIGKVRKTAKKKVEPTTQVEQKPYEEIDNFDFLYENSDDLNLEYDAMTVNSLLDEAMSHLGARYRSGRYGPYLCYDGKNYRLPKALHERAAELKYEECMAIVNKN